MVLTIVVLLHALLLAMAAAVQRTCNGTACYPLTRVVLNAGKTIEVRRSEAADAKGKSDSAAQLQRLFYSSTQDRSRARIGLPPMPKPANPPPPPTEERTKEILADDRVQVQQPTASKSCLHCLCRLCTLVKHELLETVLSQRACTATKKADVRMLRRGYTGTVCNMHVTSGHGCLLHMQRPVFGGVGCAEQREKGTFQQQRQWCQQQWQSRKAK